MVDKGMAVRAPASTLQSHVGDPAIQPTTTGAATGRVGSRPIHGVQKVKEWEKDRSRLLQVAPAVLTGSGPHVSRMPVMYPSHKIKARCNPGKSAVCVLWTPWPRPANAWTRFWTSSTRGMEGSTDT